MTVLKVTDLVVRSGGTIAVRGVSLHVEPGERVGIVGESGAGKSLTALAIMGLLPTGWTAQGSVLHDDVDLLRLSDRALSTRRGRTLSMVFQDPLSALNPTKRVGAQITDVVRRHTPNVDSTKRARELVEHMGLPRPEHILRAYPHQLSGGQRQRIMIAMAVACHPQLIIADEPTTALDVTVQKRILRLLSTVVTERGSALLLITHDLPVIAAMCDRVIVMYGGRIVEQGPVTDVLGSPRHPYTAGLLKSQPSMERLRLDPGARLPFIRGSVPPLTDMPAGCPFQPRCDYATDSCGHPPSLEGDTHSVACWHPLSTELSLKKGLR